MTLEEAIETAISYEQRVRDLYAEAARSAQHPQGKRVFEVLRDEEQGHLDYLRHCREKWRKSGEISDEALRTAVPAREAIERGLRTAGEKLEGPERERELDYLRRALDLERETGSFYRKMVAELDGAGRALFARFLEIEGAHYALVQAQIDSLDGMGFWFDTMEFRLEAG